MTDDRLYEQVKGMDAGQLYALWQWALLEWLSWYELERRQRQ